MAFSVQSWGAFRATPLLSTTSGRQTRFQSKAGSVPNFKGPEWRVLGAIFRSSEAAERKAGRCDQLSTADSLTRFIVGRNMFASSSSVGQGLETGTVGHRDPYSGGLPNASSRAGRSPLLKCQFAGRAAFAPHPRCSARAASILETAVRRRPSRVPGSFEELPCENTKPAIVFGALTRAGPCSTMIRE
jgi:hypothetical protein